MQLLAYVLVFTSSLHDVIVGRYDSLADCWEVEMTIDRHLTNADMECVPEGQE